MTTLAAGSYEDAQALSRLDREAASGSDTDSVVDQVSKHSRPWTRFAVVSGVVLLLSGIVVLASASLRWDAHSKGVTLTDKHVEIQERQLSALEFLQSDELMNNIAETSIKARCPLGSKSGSCDNKLLSASLRNHSRDFYSKVATHALLRPYARALQQGSLSRAGQNHILAAVSAMGDPSIQALAGKTASVIKQHKDDPPHVIARKLQDNLETDDSKINEVRSKLFSSNDFPDVDPEALSFLRPGGIGFSSRYGSTLMSFEMAYPRLENDKNEMTNNHAPLRRTLAEPFTGQLYADGTAPLSKMAPKGGPPPPDDMAGDIVAAIGLPFSHLVMCALHSEGKVTLPYWAKVVITVEDVLLLGVWGSTLGPIGMIVDLCLIWPKRGYVYGPYDKYPKNFLNPSTPKRV